MRTVDSVGRWGGDEFIIVLNGDLDGMQAQIESIRDWVFGKCEIQTNHGKRNITMDVTAAMVIGAH